MTDDRGASRPMQTGPDESRGLKEKGWGKEARQTQTHQLSLHSKLSVDKDG